jgi:peptidoglycan DL-endopeptidase CwlO
LSYRARARRRHRASQRAVTPLTQFTDQLTDATRTGAIAVVSTGLVAGAALPAQALGGSSASTTSAPTAAGPAVAAAPAYSAVAGGNTLTAAPAALGAAGPALSAPATAVLSFESGSYTAMPRPVVRLPAAPRRVAPAAEPRTESRLTTQSPKKTETKKPESKKAPARKAPSRKAPATGGGSSTTKGASVLSIAARYVGTPYRYGGTTPRGFDCSGYTKYVFSKLGISLPRTANAQMGATTRIKRSQARPGDLVFFVSAGRAYHVGIYAGGNKMYDSPRSGKSVSKRAIWDAAVVFGRVKG